MKPLSDLIAFSNYVQTLAEDQEDAVDYDNTSSPPGIDYAHIRTGFVIDQIRSGHIDLNDKILMEVELGV